MFTQDTRLILSLYPARIEERNKKDRGHWRSVTAYDCLDEQTYPEMGALLPWSP